jgi:hypothetical protein
MAKKISKPEAARPEELPEMDSDVVEYDATRSAAEDLVAVEESTADPGAVAVDESFVQAQAALEEQMGGFEAVAVRLAEPGDNPVGSLSNIVGWGIGEKVVGGRYTGQTAVKVYVIEKAAADDIEEEALVPSEINGLPTDVEEVGEVKALRYTGRYRPAPGGSSVGHVNITAGTLGCLVVRSNGHLCILSNNHVLANSNAARVGDPIIQPGPADGGRDPRDRIGALEAFVPLQFGGAAANLVDAAVAWTNTKLASPRHHCYRINTRPMNPALGMSVRKCGRTTQGTLGVITGINVAVRVGYGGGRVALFRNQVQIRGVGTDFSQGGDSGSLVVSGGTRQPVALLFAGGGELTFANPIGAVITNLGIRQFRS